MGFLKHDVRNRQGYLSPQYDVSFTLTGSATESTLIEIDNRVPQAVGHVISMDCVITGTNDILLKCYGSFDGISWQAIRIAALPNPTGGAAWLVMTAGALSAVYEATTYVGSLNMPVLYPWVKWTLTEDGTGSAGVIEIAVSGV